MSFFYTPPCTNDKNFAFPRFFTFILKINGCWPTDGDADNFWFQCKNILYTIWFWIVSLNLVYVVNGEFAYFFANMKDVTKAVESMCTTMIGVAIIIRTFHIRYVVKDLKKVLTEFADTIWINGNQHPHIVKRCHRNMNMTFKNFVMLWMVLVLYCFLPIILFFTKHQTMESTDKGLPYSMIFPYDAQKGWRYFVTYVMSLHAGYITVSQFHALDALNSMFISYLCGQFEILHARIARLVPECHAEWLSRCGGDGMSAGDKSDDRCLRLLQDIYTKRLHEISAHHNNLIRFCQHVNDLISFPLWVNIINSTFLICFCGFQFALGGASSFGDVLRYFLYFLSVTVQLFVICVSGTMVISHSTDTARYLYMCNWEGGQISKHSPLLLQPHDMELEKLSVKLPLWQYINYHPTGKDFQHKLRFMIMRSQRAVELNGMKFTILSLESFSKIINSSMSYFTLLITFLDK